MNRFEIRKLYALIAALMDRDGGGWLTVAPELLEGYLPDEWRDEPLGYLVHWIVDWENVTPAHCHFA
jgi:hypothetical protein